MRKAFLLGGSEWLLLLVALIWGSSYGVSKLALAYYPVLGLLAVRFVLAALCLSPSLRHAPRSAWRAGVPMGGILLAILLCETYGLAHTSAANAAFLISLCLVFTPLAEWLLFGQRPAARIWLLVALSWLGAVLLTGGMHFSASLGDALMLLAAVLRAAFGGGGGAGGGGGGGGFTSGTSAIGLGGNSGAAGAAGNAVATTPLSQSAQPSTGGFIQADPSTNSLIITAPAPLYRNLRAVIEKLDARRVQVFIESLIVEVSAEKAGEFGIQWQFLSQGSGTGSTVVGGTNLPARSTGSTASTASRCTAHRPIPLRPALRGSCFRGGD